MGMYVMNRVQNRLAAGIQMLLILKQQEDLFSLYLCRLEDWVVKFINQAPASSQQTLAQKLMRCAISPPRYSKCIFIALNANSCLAGCLQQVINNTAPILRRKVAGLASRVFNRFEHKLFVMY